MTWRQIGCYARLCALALPLTLLFPGQASAASWEVDPIRVELTPAQKTAAVTIKNGLDQPTSIQIQAVSWSQENGKDTYTPTHELLVSPPIVTIAPNSEQIIRVALRRPADASNELAYRINLQELPPPAVPGFTGVQVALRIGLPVFIQSQKGDAAARLLWHITRLADNNLRVTLENRGNAHVQVSDFSLSLPGSEQVLASEAGSSYVLAGQTRSWLLKTTAVELTRASRLRLKAYADAGNVDTEIVLEKP